MRISPLRVCDVTQRGQAALLWWGGTQWGPLQDVVTEGQRWALSTLETACSGPVAGGRDLRVELGSVPDAAWPSGGLWQGSRRGQRVRSRQEDTSGRGGSGQTEVMGLVVQTG